MSEKRNCKIVQDLLPNYIDKLTNDETNQYIEEHLAKCNECKKIFKLLDKIKKNTSICITSSNLDNILYFDNVLIMSDKTIKIKGAPKEVLQQDNELAKLGFIIPQMIDLSLKLNFYGVLDEIITDVDGMVDKLWK